MNVKKMIALIISILPYTSATALETSDTTVDVGITPEQAEKSEKASGSYSRGFNDGREEGRKEGRDQQKVIDTLDRTMRGGGGVSGGSGHRPGSSSSDNGVTQMSNRTTNADRH